MFFITCETVRYMHNACSTLHILLVNITVGLCILSNKYNCKIADNPGFELIQYNQTHGI